MDFLLIKSESEINHILFSERFSVAVSYTRKDQ